MTLEAQEASRVSMPAFAGKGAGQKMKRNLERSMADLWNEMFPRIRGGDAETREKALAFKARMEARREAAQ